jgi:ParB/RepB/Spo0J family partition protein
MSTTPEVDGTAAADGPAADESSPSGGKAPQEATITTERVMIEVDRLRPHPKHVRVDRKLTRQFLASIKVSGVLESLHVVPDHERPGDYLIIEGRRRWEGAKKVGRTKVPCDVDVELGDNEARQHLAQYIANDPELRQNHNPYEQVQALFEAAAAGATRTEIRQATGLTAPQVKEVFQASKLRRESWRQVAEGDYEYTMPELALLAEFQDDEQATQLLQRAKRYEEPLEAVAHEIRQVRADEAEHQRLVKELTEQGVQITEDLPAGALELDKLRPSVSDEEGGEEVGDDVLGVELHRECPGRGAHFPYSLTEPVHYCADPVKHGHGFVEPRVGQRMRLRAELVAAGETVTEGLPPGAWRLTALRQDGQDLTPEAHRECPGAGVCVPLYHYGPVEPVYYCREALRLGHTTRAGEAASTKKAEETPRALVVRANRQWGSASKHRREFLAQLLRKRSAPKGAAVFITQQLLHMPEPLKGGNLGSWLTEPLFRDFTGKSLKEAKEQAERAATGQLHILLLAEIAAAFEYAIAGDGDRRHTWRTDSKVNPYCKREDAGAYLAFLVASGYKATLIERAVITGTPYTENDPDQVQVSETADQADEPTQEESEQETADSTTDEDQNDKGQDQDEHEGREEKNEKNGGEATDEESSDHPQAA